LRREDPISKQNSPVSEQKRPKLKHLELKKETVRELTEREAERAEGDFTMRDSVIVRTGVRRG